MPHKCETCGKVCGDKTKLREHQRKHTGERPYQCSFCEKTFATKGITKRHEDVTHTQTNFKICDECGSNFSTRRGLEAHLQKAHGILNRFKCEKCSTYFLTEEGMKQHVAINSCKESTCPVCGKIFPCKSKLTQHMRVHSDERRHFECVDCAKQFNHEQSLKQHIDIIHLDLLDELGENLEASEEKEDAAMEETSFNKSKKDFIKFIEIARTDIKNDAHAKLKLPT